MRCLDIHILTSWCQVLDVKVFDSCISCMTSSFEESFRTLAELHLIRIPVFVEELAFVRCSIDLVFSRVEDRVIPGRLLHTLLLSIWLDNCKAEILGIHACNCHVLRLTTLEVCLSFAHRGDTFF